MMMNCFCGMIDRRKAFSLTSSRDHCQRSSPSRISDMPQAGFEPAQNLSSGLVEWSCAVVITTTPRRKLKTEGKIKINFDFVLLGFLSGTYYSVRYSVLCTTWKYELLKLQGVCHLAVNHCLLPLAITNKNCGSTVTRHIKI